MTDTPRSLIEFQRRFAGEIVPGSLVATDGRRACDDAPGVLPPPRIVAPQPARPVLPPSDPRRDSRQERRP